MRKTIMLLALLTLACLTSRGQRITFGWGTTDVRYGQTDMPAGLSTGTLRLRAWRGERVNAQAVVYADRDLSAVTVRATSTLPDSLFSTHFVGYVWTDELNKDRRSGCGHRPDKTAWDSSLVADMLDTLTITRIAANHAQPVWLKITVPQSAKPGRYRGKLTLKFDSEISENSEFSEYSENSKTQKLKNSKTQSLPFELEILDRTLPSPDRWAFHLDLWQNPYAVARYYDVPLWSREHFDAMLPVFRRLASIGQRSITTSIMHHPWNAQTYDPYDSMIGRTRRIDGTWAFDYTVFDRYVEWMQTEVGITDMISCYTMIPWALSFDYYDQATSRVQFVKAKPGEQAYTDYWLPFLRDFASHLRQKGWFDKTAISMDERPMEQMREAIKVIRQADPEFKITLAGGYHPEIIDDLHYLSIPYGVRFPDDVKAKRAARGQLSTVYTCCVEPFPNMFTFSAPAESSWTVIHALAAGYDGWLRWAVNSWPERPTEDSRFWSWAAGDTYSLYPGGRTSIRFERLTEGLQDCEKIHQLRSVLRGRRLDRLEALLARFTPEHMAEGRQSAADMVRELHDLLNE